MAFIKNRLKYLFSETRGLIILNISIISLIVAVFGMLSGPMKDWGIAEFVKKILGIILPDK